MVETDVSVMLLTLVCIQSPLCPMFTFQHSQGMLYTRRQIPRQHQHFTNRCKNVETHSDVLIVPAVEVEITVNNVWSANGFGLLSGRSYGRLVLRGIA
jgi:hypothetical protein